MIYTNIVKWGGGILVGIVFAWILYAGLIRPTTKPNPSTTQNAGNITNNNYYYQPRMTGFGCATSRVYEKYPTNSTH